MLSGSSKNEGIVERAETKYNATIILSVPKGALSVTPTERKITDLLSGTKKTENESFDKLKSAVASWALETSMQSTIQQDSHNVSRDELVLAYGTIDVDLSGQGPRRDNIVSGVKNLKGASSEELHLMRPSNSAICAPVITKKLRRNSNTGKI
jgi:hypothetical protein